MTVNGLIPAAGMSRRMGRFKPLLRIGEKTMIETAVDRMLAAGVNCVTVTLGYRGDEIERLLRQRQEECRSRKERIRFACNPDYETTQMLDSVKAGLLHMEDCDWFFVLPGDMPAVSEETFRILSRKAQRTDKKIVFPTFCGRRKHPPLISWSLKEDILEFQGEGLRELWGVYEDQILEIPLPDEGCSMDADDPSDYQKICEYIQELSFARPASRAPKS